MKKKIFALTLTTVMSFSMMLTAVADGATVEFDIDVKGGAEIWSNVNTVFANVPTTVSTEASPAEVKVNNSENNTTPSGEKDASSDVEDKTENDTTKTTTKNTVQSVTKTQLKTKGHENDREGISPVIIVVLAVVVVVVVAGIVVATRKKD